MFFFICLSHLSQLNKKFIVAKKPKHPDIISGYRKSFNVKLNHCEKTRVFSWFTLKIHTCFQDQNTRRRRDKFTNARTKSIVKVIKKHSLLIIPEISFHVGFFRLSIQFLFDNPR